MGTIPFLLLCLHFVPGSKKPNQLEAYSLFAIESSLAIAQSSRHFRRASVQGNLPLGIDDQHLFMAGSICVESMTRFALCVRISSQCHMQGAFQRFIHKRQALLAPGRGNTQAFLWVMNQKTQSHISPETWLVSWTGAVEVKGCNSHLVSSGTGIEIKPLQGLSKGIPEPLHPSLA